MDAETRHQQEHHAKTENGQLESSSAHDATGGIDGFTPVPGFAFPPRDVLAQIAAHNHRGNRTMPKMRAKMYVTSVVTQPNVTQETLKLSCVASSPFGPNGESEDNTFARYTPFGTAEYGITNPALIGQFKQGDKFYVDFTPAE